MKAILVLTAVVAACLATERVTILSREEITDELISNPRYIIWETPDGLFEVEDLHNTTVTPGLFATEDDITFYFFTPENPTRGVLIKESQLHDIVRLTGFNVRRETLIIIHGWRNDFESAVNDRIKNAALRDKNINVIVVDWSPIASRGYLTAQGAVLRVGNYIGDFLLRLDDELNHRLDHHVTIVGHSLGAHVSGNAGARTRGVINTIIGLDPAGPLFSEGNINNRLDPTDAGYVHVIHTNDGLLGYGINMGHADYFPNGGRSQPGCGIDLVGTCAHSRAYDYYAESLHNNNFFSRRCGSYNNYQSNQCNSNTASYLGSFPVQRSPTAEYYLTTNSASPFARG